MSAPGKEGLGENAPAFSDEDLALALRGAAMLTISNSSLPGIGGSFGTERDWQFEETLRAWDFARPDMP